MASFSTETPFFEYDLAKVRSKLNKFNDVIGGFASIRYATMANINDSIIDLFLENNQVGFFVTSIAHLEYLINKKADPARIVFAASGLTKDEIRYISSFGVFQYMDSLNQVDVFLEENQAKKFGIRVNSSQVDSLAYDPFKHRIGIHLEDFQKIREIQDVTSLHMYVGTNREDVEIYTKAIEVLSNIIDTSRLSSIASLNIGGGFSSSDENLVKCLKIIKNTWSAKSNLSNIKLIVEPGRSLVERACRLFTTITDIKINGPHRHIMVNVSATCCPRRLLHGLEVVGATVIGRSDSLAPAVICGNTTLSYDIFGISNLSNDAKIGDTLIIQDVGAYSENCYIGYLGAKKPRTIYIDTE
jgi:diaminopimelate decarboxylase